MSKFNIGDVIYAKISYQGLQKDAPYKVVGTNDIGCVWVSDKDDKPLNFWFAEERFNEQPSISDPLTTTNEISIGSLVQPIEDCRYIKKDQVYRVTVIEEECNSIEVETLEGAKIDCPYKVFRFRPVMKEHQDPPNDIEHSPHYSVGKIEVIDFIQDQDLNFALGNAIKYICRCNYKGTKEKDLKKAIQYLKYELEVK
jgi:hypothetical protein|nr:MAG TPA: nucelotide kinase [Caudoviricetes sp.]